MAARGGSKKGKGKKHKLASLISLPNSLESGIPVTVHTASTGEGTSKRTESYLPDRSSPTKRRRTDTNTADKNAHQTANAQASTSAEKEGPPKGKKSAKETKGQTMSALLLPFTLEFDKIADYVLALEGDPLVMGPCPCGEGTRTTRCRDCFMSGPVCDQCFFKNHKNSPFHFAEKWNGRFFDRVPQASLGRILHIGHDGDRCPRAHARAEPLMLDVVDLSGVHSCRVIYCKCKEAGHNWEQLLKLGLFPATLSKTATVFSITLLKHFDLLSTISKTTAMDFVSTIRRVTNNAFPDDVSDFYKSFRRTMRVWRALQIRKRAGDFHGMQALTGDASAFFLALKCPACPQPGFNMPIRWSVVVSDENKHKYTLFLSIDGNFKQQLKIKNCDPDDIELFIAFFARKEIFDAYFSACKSNVEKSTCANLKANNLQSQLKFLSMVISGIMSCKCARHDMYRPGATVDLKKGESFAYTDFALRQALEGFESYPEIVLSYDIACQYSKKAAARFGTHFPDCKPAIERARFYVPKLHGHGHSDDCRYQFSFDFAENVGRTHGERIESGWAEGNLAGPTTREMNPGHRHETLSAIYNEWNYQQTIKLGCFLATKLLEARRQSAKKRAHFDKISLSMGNDRVKIWENLDTAPVVKNGEVTRVYRVNNAKVPTMDDIEECLITEDVTVKSNAARMKPAQFIANGVKLEMRQRSLRSKVKSDDASLRKVAIDIDAERSKLQSDISSWRDDQALYMPEVLGYVSESALAEAEQLYLPSALSKRQRDTPWFKQLAEYETLLRKGQADDALSNLRVALRYKDSLGRGRQRIAYGQRNSTRAAVLIRRVAHLVDGRAATYRQARQALISLGMSPSDSRYPELKKEDVFLKRVYANKDLGEGTRTGSWIWENGSRAVQSGLEEDEWEEEGNRVEWFRARIDAKQWLEETEILEEELSRTERWFSKMAELWTALAAADARRGFAEYAYEKAALFDRRSSDVKQWHDWAVQSKLDAE